VNRQVEFLTTLYTVAPHATLGQALSLLTFDSDEPAVDLNTHEGKVAFAKADAAIRAEVSNDRKIQAIKLLRDACSKAGAESSLLSSKNAIDAIWPAVTSWR
jgi:hypothetical protein